MHLQPSQAKPSQAKPSQAKPSQAKPSQAKPSQASRAASRAMAARKTFTGSKVAKRVGRVLYAIVARTRAMLHCAMAVLHCATARQVSKYRASLLVGMYYERGYETWVKRSGSHAVLMFTNARSTFMVMTLIKDNRHKLKDKIIQKS